MKKEDEKNKCPTNNTLARRYGTNIPQGCYKCDKFGECWYWWFS